MESMINTLYLVSLIVFFILFDGETAAKAFIILSLMLMTIRMGTAIALMRTITGNLVIIRRNYEPTMDRDEAILSASVEVADEMEDEYNEANRR